MILPRAAWPAAVIVAVLAVTGCAAETAPPPSQSVSPSASTSAPTAEAAPPPRVPLDGQCDRALSPEAEAIAFDGQSASLGKESSLASVMPDTGASAALLGGLSCFWWSETSRLTTLVVQIFPEDAVPADIRERNAEFGCEGWGLCGRGETRSGVWVRAAGYRWMMETDLTAEEEQLLVEAVDATIVGVFARSIIDLTGVPVEPRDGRWSLSSCDPLEAAVLATTGFASPEQGFPGDNVPEGTLWDILVANGAARWCAWYSADPEDLRIVEIDLQSGVGTPVPDQLASVNAQSIEIPGADAAFLLSPDGSGRDVTKVLAVDGDNRLTVSGVDAQLLAAALLQALDG